MAVGLPQPPRSRARTDAKMKVRRFIFSPIVGADITERQGKVKGLASRFTAL
jgi:hypothetical protein